MTVSEGKSFIHFYGFVRYRTIVERKMRVNVHLRWTMQWGGVIERQIMEWWEPVGPLEENRDMEDEGLD